MTLTEFFQKWVKVIPDPMRNDFTNDFIAATKSNSPVIINRSSDWEADKA